MPKRRAMTREEMRTARAEIRRRAEAGELRLPEGIADMRRAIGKTQAEFAAALGLTRTQLSALERGVANPTRETLERIGRPFGFRIGFVPKGDG